MEKVTEELSRKKEKSRMDKLIILNDPDTRQRIVSLKNEGEGRSWSEVAKLFNYEMDADYSPGALQNAYEQELSLTIEISGNKEKLFSSNIKSVQDRYARVNKTLDKYQEIVDKIIDEGADLPDTELLMKVDDLFKAGKQIEIIYKMVDKNIGLLLAEQEKVLIKKEKNQKPGLTEKDVAMKFKKYLPEILKTLEIQGKISILDRKTLKN